MEVEVLGAQGTWLQIRSPVTSDKPPLPANNNSPMIGQQDHLGKKKKKKFLEDRKKLREINGGR